MSLRAIIIQGNEGALDAFKRAVVTHNVELIAESPTEPDFIELIRRHRAHIILLTNKESASPAPGRIAVRRGRRTVMLDLEMVDYLEAAHNHVIVRAGGEKHVLRGSLTGFRKRVPKGQFFPISRGIIVNLRKVREVKRSTKGARAVVLQNGQKFPLSRRIRSAEILRQLELR